MDVGIVNRRYSSDTAASSREKEVQNHKLTFIQVSKEIMDIPIGIGHRKIDGRCQIRLSK
jgi:hypothetical protein